MEIERLRSEVELHKSRAAKAEAALGRTKSGTKEEGDLAVDEEEKEAGQSWQMARGPDARKPKQSE